jgi:vancomycin resistance protein YoaR
VREATDDPGRSRSPSSSSSPHSDGFDNDTTTRWKTLAEPTEQFDPGGRSLSLGGLLGGGSVPARPAIKIAAGVLGAVVLLFFIAAIGFGRLHDNVVYPGVSVGGVDLGDTTPEQAQARLEKQLAGYMPVEMKLVFQDKEWQPAAADIGVRVDLAESSRGAYAVGREGFFLQAIVEQFGSSLLGHRAPLVLAIDDDKLDAYVRQLASEIDQPVVEGGLTLNGTEVQAIPSQDGRKLDVETTKEAIKKQIASLSHEPLGLSVAVVKPQLSSEDVAKGQAALNNIVFEPVYLNHEKDSWELPPDQIAPMVVISGTGTGNPIDVSLDRVKLKDYVNGLAKDIDQEAKDAVLTWSDDQLTVVEPSKEGRTLDITKTVELIAQAAPTENHDVTLPIAVVKPKVSSDNLDALGIKGLIGEGESAFTGSSSSRADNIATAVSYLDGYVIAPGETFSFNKAVGDITVERGFEEGLTIQADQTRPGVGGGVCQVSTTTFRAAFWAGLPIVERNQHTYRVGWYEQDGEPVGFDAAIYQPDLDMRFENNTSAYILVQAYTDGSMLYVDLYGTDQGLEVTLDGPYTTEKVPPPPDVIKEDPSLPPGTKNQVDWAVAGIDATIYRIVTDKDGNEVSKDTFYSHFKAWPNMYMVGPTEGSPTPGTPAPNQTPEATPETTPQESPAEPTPISTPETAPTP